VEDKRQELREAEGDVSLEVAPEELAGLAATLRDDPTLVFDYPADLTAWDTGEEIVLWYRLYAMSRNRTVLIHVRLDRERPSVPTLTGLWPGFNWHEREVFDLYGVQFTDHPDAQSAETMRILLPEDWEGHPFRKDYEPIFSGDPLHGPQETN
jgi:NADH-quinone oxidoreductase subunit C